MKRRITLVVDDDERKRRGFERFPFTWAAVSVESVEDIPDPDRVQEFRVRIVSKSYWQPRTAQMIQTSLSHFEGVTVTEVDPTEVER